MKMKLSEIFTSGAIIMALIAEASPSHADEAAATGWSGDIGLGYVATSGNTETESVNFKSLLTYRAAPWSYSGKLDVLKGSDSDKTIADRVSAEVKADRSLDEASYIFALLNYEDDRFSGYDYRVSETAGYGRRLVRTDAYTLNAEAGLGARQSKASETGQDEREAILRLAGLFEWRISAAATFSEELDGESGGGVAVSRSITTLTTQVAGNLAAKFSLRVSHDSAAPTGVERTDSETTVNLVYKF